MSENRCVCCGDIIPEGLMVCPDCEKFEAPCPSYGVRNVISAVDHNIIFRQPICFGTKECDPCSCEGHPIACNYYPEKRAAAEKMRNELNFKRLKNEAKKLGYRLVKRRKKKEKENGTC